MGKPPSRIEGLTDLQLAVMRAVWAVGPGTLNAVHEHVARERDLAVTTVGTVLTRLRKQRLVSARRHGRQLIYEARVTEFDVQRNLIRRVVDRLFGGDSVALVQHLVVSGSVDKGDARKIRELISRATEGRKP